MNNEALCYSAVWCCEPVGQLKGKAKSTRYKAIYLFLCNTRWTMKLKLEVLYTMQKDKNNKKYTVNYTLIDIDLYTQEITCAFLEFVFSRV